MCVSPAGSDQVMSSGDDDDDEDHRYRVQTSAATHTQQEGHRTRETNRKSHSNAAGRLRRVVSFRRKTHHHLYRGAPSPVKSRGGQRRTEEDWSCCSQISEGHDLLLDALHSRRLRLSVALTLWRRNPGELLEFLERLQDPSVLIHCLPALTRSVQQECAQVTVGFCVDLFPLVRNLLQSRFEDYLVSALIWIQTVLERWSSVLTTDRQLSDHRNTDVLRLQLQDLWTLKTHLTDASDTTARIWKAIESHLIQF